MASDKNLDTRHRLEKCWEIDIDWNLYPAYLRDGCFQVGKALSVSPSAVLGGLVSVTSFTLAPAVVTIPGVDWAEPAIMWLSMSMPAGSGASSLYKYLNKLICRVRRDRGCKAGDPSWLVGDSTFEEMGELMSNNNGCLFGLYDELSTFLAQINLFGDEGLTVSHKLALFIRLYNGSSWSHKTVGSKETISMEETNLVVGGFSQPSVSRALIECQRNVEKNFSQCFLWLFPKPLYAKFESLEPVDEEFTKLIGSGLACKHISPATKLKFQVAHSSDSFRRKYNELQEQLNTLAAKDDLLAGLLSESKGQVLRLAACLQTLFTLQTDLDKRALSGNAEIIHISEDATQAAINFVEVCVQHAAFMAGRGLISDETRTLATESCDVEGNKRVDGAAAHTLRLPGQRLFLTPLLKAKKFRRFGYKEGALSAFRELQKSELGTLEEFEPEKGTFPQYLFLKAPIPEDTAEFEKKLSKYSISLKEYKDSLTLPEITAPTKQRDNTSLHAPATTGRKRTLSGSSPCSSPKRLVESSTNDCNENIENLSLIYKFEL